MKTKKKTSLRSVRVHGLTFKRRSSAELFAEEYRELLGYSSDLRIPKTQAEMIAAMRDLIASASVSKMALNDAENQLTETREQLAVALSIAAKQAKAAAKRVGGHFNDDIPF